jgi:type IV fimbrial biogenesis protein FimT
MRRKNSGFTVIELLIAVTVAAIILALAMPSYQDVINKRAVTNAAERTATFIALARSESVKRNEAITIKMDTTGNGFCIGITSEADCDCFETGAAEADFCQIDDGGSTTRVAITDEAMENVSMPPALSSGLVAKTSVRLTFDPVRGILDTVNDSAGEVLFTSRNDNFALRVDTVLSGRVELCTPSGKTVPGYTACPEVN